MKIQPKVKKFQEGGPVAPEAPVEQLGALQDPMAMVMLLATQAVQGQDCQAAMQLAQIVLEMAQQQAPQEALGEPVYRRGGQLVKRIKK